MRERLPVTLPTSGARSGPTAFEHHRARIAFQRLGHVGEIGGAAAPLELLGGQRLDEAAQPESLQIGRRCGPDRLGLIDDVHDCGSPLPRIIAQSG